MWTILFIVFISSNGPDYSRTPKSVSSQLIGNYSHLDKCEVIAKQLTKSIVLENYSYTWQTAQCVQIK